MCRQTALAIPRCSVNSELGSKVEAVRSIRGRGQQLCRRVGFVVRLMEVSGGMVGVRAGEEEAMQLHCLVRYPGAVYCRLGSKWVCRSKSLWVKMIFGQNDNYPHRRASLSLVGKWFLSCHTHPWYLHVQTTVLGVTSVEGVTGFIGDRLFMVMQSMIYVK
jgi:hypothetical protein